MNSITIGLNLPNDVKEKTPWKNSQFSVLQCISTTCYSQSSHSGSSQQNECEKKKSYKKTLEVPSVNKDSLFLFYGIIMPPHILPMLLQNCLTTFYNHCLLEVLSLKNFP